MTALNVTSEPVPQVVGRQIAVEIVGDLLSTGIVGDAATIRGDDADAFGRVHRAPATESDESVTSLLSKDGIARFDIANSRIRLDASVLGDPDTGPGNRAGDRRDMTGFLHAWVGNDQRFRDPKLRQTIAGLSESAPPIENARRAFEGMYVVPDHSNWLLSSRPGALHDLLKST